MKPYFQQSLEGEDVTLRVHEKKSGDKGGCGFEVLPVTVKLPEFYGTVLLIYPIHSMYYNGILTYIGLILMVNVGCKYTIHGWYESMGCFSRTKRMSCNLHKC